MTLSRTQLLFILAIYMTCALALLELVGASANSENHIIGGFGVNIITSVSIFPAFFNIILFGIPSIIIVLIIVSWFIPTINPGQ